MKFSRNFFPLKQLGFLFLMISTLSSCIEDTDAIVFDPNPDDRNNTEEIKNYLHLSHTRETVNPNLIQDVENLDFDKYDMLWLGGDIAYQSSLDNDVMSRIDSILDVGNPNTLWALGNHDYNDLNRITAFTNRSPYYTYHKNGITFIVLDTQDSLSNIVGEQKALFNRVIDTPSKIQLT